MGADGRKLRLGMIGGWLSGRAGFSWRALGGPTDGRPGRSRPGAPSGGSSAARAGRRAERRAERHLRRRGLVTLARNFRKPFGEIDLIMREGAVLVFVEVRLRGPGAWTDGAASVDPAKQRRLARAAEAYLAKHPRYASDVSRFDVVSMSGTNFGANIVWITDAFSSSSQ